MQAKQALYKRMKGFYGVNKQKKLLRAAVCWMPVLKTGFRRLTLDEFILLEKELKDDYQRASIDCTRNTV